MHVRRACIVNQVWSVRGARLSCQSAAFECQMSVGSVWRWANVSAFLSARVLHACVRMSDSSCLTGICHCRGFRAPSVGSLPISLNSLIVSHGLCRGGALCVCLCPISSCFQTHTFKLLSWLQTDEFLLVLSNLRAVSYLHWGNHTYICTSQTRNITNKLENCRICLLSCFFLIRYIQNALLILCECIWPGLVAIIGHFTWHCWLIKY